MPVRQTASWISVICCRSKGFADFLHCNKNATVRLNRYILFVHQKSVSSSGHSSSDLFRDFGIV